MSDRQDSMRIDASPTKEFFIHMLTRDIGLSRAIADLVDNSVDGALRIRPNRDFSNLWVRLSTTSDSFIIEDNCGGIDVSVAREYAFRFGRLPEVKQVSHSIGQFGVGMKRALFKMGRHFRIESTTSTTRFVVDQDVDEWSKNKDPDWHFQFRNLEEFDSSSEDYQIGTKITVTKLRDSVRTEFELNTFRAQLRRDLESAHQQSMANGLRIEVNGSALNSNPLQLLVSKDLRPAHFRQTISLSSPVQIRYYAGVAQQKPNEAGWNIICNDRLVLASDQTAVTGWGQGSEVRIPRYHNQFSRFRGYTFFDCDDASLLPWNTTKDGVEENSRIYRNARLQMINLTRPVIDFLNRVDEENDAAKDDRKLEQIIMDAKMTALSEIRSSKSFIVKMPKGTTTPAFRRIQYNRPTEQVDQVMEELGVQTLREVGELTFDYFFDVRCQKS